MSEKKVKYISASQINMFLTCPIAYYNIYVLGAERMPPNIYMVYGTAIHKALEFNFKQKIKSKKDMPIDSVNGAFLNEFIKEQKKVKEYVSPTVIRSMELSAYDSLKDYMENIAPDIQPLEVEFKFEISLKNFPITILGYIDLLTDDYVVRDYKSAGKDWKRKFSQSKVDKDIQMTMYAAAIRKLFKTKETGLIFDVMPRCETKVFPIKTTRTDEDVLALLQLATSIEQITKLGVFVPAYQNCSQCGFKNTCKKRPIIDT